MRRVVVKSAPPRPRAPKPPPREEPKNASVVEQQPVRLAGQAPVRSTPGGPRASVPLTSRCHELAHRAPRLQEPRVIVPPDQLTLTPKELEEDMTR